MKAQEIIALARETLGTPYRHQGRIGTLSVDCAGVPVHVATRLGLPLSDYARYGRLPNPAEMRAALDRNLVRVSKADMQLGDVAWIRFNAEPQHLAIIGDCSYGGFSLIHAYNGAGLNKVVEHRLDSTWLARIAAMWRYPGVEL
jgi:cell wall-associated NlpC family hydrolase